MIEIKVYQVIGEEDVFAEWLGMEPMTFSADNVHKVFDNNPDETDFKFKINSNGGSVSEGLRIYDVIRTSGKNIHTDIEGACHSMAMIILLAGAKENRTANPNARALIHEVRGGVDGTAEEIKAYADQVLEEQNNILDIYAERTGYDRTELERIMKEEKIHTANELLQYGFISKINTYSTNQKKGTMSKKQKQDVLNQAEKFLSKLKNMFNSEDETTFDHVDADGNVLFSTQNESDSLEVGDSASPDGTFELPDGRNVVIEDGKINSIEDAPSDPVNEEEIEELQNENSELKARNTELEEALTESQEIITDLRNQLTSDGKPQRRNRALGKPTVKPSVAELKDEARERRSLTKNKKDN